MILKGHPVLKVRKGDTFICFQKVKVCKEDNYYLSLCSLDDEDFSGFSSMYYRSRILLTEKKYIREDEDDFAVEVISKKNLDIKIVRNII